MKTISSPLTTVQEKQDLDVLLKAGALLSTVDDMEDSIHKIALTKLLTPVIDGLRGKFETGQFPPWPQTVNTA